MGERNPTIPDMLADLQTQGGEAGSWPPDSGFIGSSCGRLGTTALTLMTLQVYYRYSPAGKAVGK